MVEEMKRLVEMQSLGAAEIKHVVLKSAQKKDKSTLILWLVQGHFLWWHLLIFYICIDELSIILMPFFMGIIQSTSWHLSQDWAHWRGSGQRRGPVSPAPNCSVFEVPLAYGQSQSYCSSEARGLWAYTQLPPPFLLWRGWGKDSWVTACSREAELPWRLTSCVACSIGTGANHMHQEESRTVFTPGQ